MPYRRLPNTDIARLKALQKALDLSKEIPPFKLAFSQQVLQRLRNFFPSFEQMMHQQKASYSSQTAKSKELSTLAKRAKLYVSHFYQVLNFAILRNEIPNSARKFYGLKENSSKLPSLNTEKEILIWGERLIKGESERISNGGNPITNPTAAVVRVRYEQFAEAARSQKILQKTTCYASDQIAGMRADADSIILQIWNEVEKTYDLLPEDAKRLKASRYGVNYVYRPYERESNASINFINDDNIENESNIIEGIQLQRINQLEESDFHNDLNEKVQLQYSMYFSKNDYKQANT